MNRETNTLEQCDEGKKIPQIPQVLSSTNRWQYRVLQLFK